MKMFSSIQGLRNLIIHSYYQNHGISIPKRREINKNIHCFLYDHYKKKKVRKRGEGGKDVSVGFCNK